MRSQKWLEVNWGKVGKNLKKANVTECQWAKEKKSTVNWRGDVGPFRCLGFGIYSRNTEKLLTFQAGKWHNPIYILNDPSCSRVDPAL